MNSDLVEPAQLMSVDVAATTWTIHRSALADGLQRLGILPVDLDSLIAVLAVEEVGDLPYQLRVGDWRIDLRAAAARALINGATLTAALAATHQTSVPATVLSVVIPLLFDLERVTLSPTDRYLYAALLNAPQSSFPVEQWYQHLPARVTAELTELEFRDVMGRLEEAGAIEIDAAGEATPSLPTPRRLVRLALPVPPDQSEYR
jgi:hypothetical protein